MNFAWDDERMIRPVWRVRKGQHPTIILPAIQKNRKVEEIPMLPGLQKLLNPIPESDRKGFVVNPLPIEYQMKSNKNWFMPAVEDLETLIRQYSNVAIAEACGVKETTVRNWLLKLVLRRQANITRYGEKVPDDLIDAIRKRAVRTRHQRKAERLSGSMKNGPLLRE